MKTIGSIAPAMFFSLLLGACGLPEQASDNSSDSVSIVIYRLIHEERAAEVERFLGDGASEESLEDQGFIKIQRRLVSESMNSVPKNVGSHTRDYVGEEELPEYGPTSFILFSHERANVKHRVSANSCKRVFASADAPRVPWWAQYAVPTNVTSDWSYKVGGGGWIWWTSQDISNTDRETRIWAGSPAPEFRYQFANRATEITLSLGNPDKGYGFESVVLYADRRISLRSEWAHNSVCGH